MGLFKKDKDKHKDTDKETETETNNGTPSRSNSSSALPIPISLPDIRSPSPSLSTPPSLTIPPLATSASDVSLSSSSSTSVKKKEKKEEKEKEKKDKKDKKEKEKEKEKKAETKSNGTSSRPNSYASLPPLSAASLQDIRPPSPLSSSSLARESSGLFKKKDKEKKDKEKKDKEEKKDKAKKDKDKEKKKDKEADRSGYSSRTSSFSSLPSLSAASSLQDIHPPSPCGSLASPSFLSSSPSSTPTILVTSPSSSTIETHPPTVLATSSSSSSITSSSFASPSFLAHPPSTLTTSPSSTFTTPRSSSPSPPDTPKILTPKSGEEIETTFIKLLVALGYPQEKQNEMMQWDSEKKMQLILQHKSKGTKKVDPQAQVNVLKHLAESSLKSSHEMRERMAKVKLCIATNVVGWVAKFIALGGFHALLDLFRKSVIAKIPNAPLIAESILTLKTLMNTPPGMKATVETPAMYKLVITAIAICGVSAEPPPLDMSVARQISQNGMDVLTAVGLVPPDGHRLVLEAANTLDRNPRFYWLLRELWAAIPLLPESASLLVSGMSLINVIVNSPDELRVRVVLRNELFALGLDGLLWALSERQTASEKLTNQLATFTDLHEDDMFELETRFENIASDPVDLVRQLIRKLERTPIYTSLVSVLHNLATVSGGKVTPSKVKCWRHIETSINRIVLHDIGTTMDVDVAHLSSILNKNEFGNTVPMPWAEFQTHKNSFQASGGAWMKVDVPVNGGRVELPRSASEGSRKHRNSFSKMNGFGESLSSFDSDGENNGDEDMSGVFSMKAARSKVTNELSKPQTRPSSMSLPHPEVSPPMSASAESSPGMTKSSSAPMPPPPPPPGKKNLVHKALMGTTKPKSKTKQLQWQKLPENKIAAAAFWAKAVHLDLATDAIFVESMFAAKVKSSMGRKTLLDDRSSFGERGESNGSKLSILDPKREHNIEIMLSSRLKRHPRVISEAILTLNDNLVDAEGVSQILKSLPSDEEIKKLHSLSLEDIPRLGKSEVFLLEILKVPRLQNKLECWIYMITFASTIDDVIPALTSVRQASEQIIGSKNFAYMLHMILALGNFLNFGGGQGNALGFKLEGLTKLRDVKTADNKGSLLNVLANVLENRHPEVLDFFSDILAVEDARKVSGSLLKSKVHSLRTGFTALNNELAQEGRNEQVFMDKVSAFLAKAKPKIEQVGALSSAMDKAYTSLLNFFGEDPTTQPEDLFELLAKFATMLAAAHAENESRKRREAYITKRSMRHIARPPPDASTEKRKPLAIPGAPAQGNASGPESAQGTGAQPAVDAGIDTILHEIQNGGVEAIVARRPTLDSDVRPNISTPLTPLPSRRIDTSLAPSPPPFRSLSPSLGAPPSPPFPLDQSSE